MGENKTNRPKRKEVRGREREEKENEKRACVRERVRQEKKNGEKIMIFYYLVSTVHSPNFFLVKIVSLLWKVFVHF
jgi:hypothetical protein